MNNKFKVGDRIVRTGVSFRGAETGKTYIVKSIDVDYDGFICLEGPFQTRYDPTFFELAVEGDKSNWHPHHDVIVAWGAEIQSRYGDDSMWIDCEHPKFWVDWEHRIKPTNNNQDQISKIESEMRELSEKQKELADCLNELKKEM